jgi:hypothetical protein
MELHVGSELEAYNRGYARFLSRLAWGIELTLAATGVGIAAAMIATAADWREAFPIFGPFLVMAAAELTKIPAAVVTFHLTGWRRALPAAALLVVSLISFQTIFNGFERFTTAMAEPVVRARQELTDLRAAKQRLGEVALEDRSGVAGVRDEIAGQRAEHEAMVAAARAELDAARADSESPEARALRARLDQLERQQAEAVERAGSDWDAQQASILDRLRADSGLDQRMRDQLNAVMHAMPTRQAAVDTAAAPFAAGIAGLRQQLSRAETAPSPAARARVERAEDALAAAVAARAAFEAEAARRMRESAERAEAARRAAEARSAQIEALEERIVGAGTALAQAAAASQMHRWASFVFGAAPAEVSDAEAKRVAAVFGAAMAVAAALAGSLTAVFGEWFRVRGVAPLTIEVPVETRVEVEVPVEVRVPVETPVEVRVPVEVPVPVDRFVYVPMPAGPGSDEILDEVLARLPPRVAAALRGELGAGARGGGGHGA